MNNQLCGYVSIIGKPNVEEVFQSKGMKPPKYNHHENALGFECSLVFKEKNYLSTSKSKQSAETKVAEQVLEDIRIINE